MGEAKHAIIRKSRHQSHDQWRAIPARQLSKTKGDPIPISCINPLLLNMSIYVFDDPISL